MRKLSLNAPYAASICILAAGLVFFAGATRPVIAQDQVVSVSATDGKSLKKAIEALKGKVVVVNLWATWCAPCVEEFPDLVKLHKTYKEKGLTVVAVSLDDPEDKGKVVSFIEAQKAGFPVYVRGKGSVDDFVNPLDRGWAGVVPTTYVFDKTGKRVGKTITGKRSYEHFQSAVEPLLK